MIGTMAAILFFCDGRIVEFPDATLTERRDGCFYVFRYTPQLTLERFAAFPADEVAIALIHTGEMREANQSGLQQAAPAADALIGSPHIPQGVRDTVSARGSV
jgi:hypothetical protein